MLVAELGSEENMSDTPAGIRSEHLLNETSELLPDKAWNPQMFCIQH